MLILIEWLVAGATSSRLHFDGVRPGLFGRLMALFGKGHFKPPIWIVAVKESNLAGYHPASYQASILP